MSDTELVTRMGELTTQLKAAVDVMDASRETDTARWREADASRDQIVKELVDVKAKLDKEEIEKDHVRNVAEAKALLNALHAPSKAAQIGTGFGGKAAASPALFGDGYQKGSLISALYGIRPGANPDEYAEAKAVLATLGLNRAEMAGVGINMGTTTEGKANLGGTGATGGYVLANNLVDQVVKPNTQQAIYTQPGGLLTVRTGVNVRGIDLPYRTGAPARATVQSWGATKENTSEDYGSYTASMVTLARIYDVGKQYLRFSAGSAEEDVMDELGKAIAVGENYYVINGAGTAGNNGDPYGIYTALQVNPANYRTTSSPVSNTVLGSAAYAFTQMAGQLGSRSRYPDGIVTDAVSYWTFFGQGSDSAGFWMSELLGAGFSVGSDNSLRFRGIKIEYDANFTSKLAIMGEWKQAKFFRGDEFRIESSDQAGTRWDQNLVGFRGEEEIAFNAAPYVAVGAFQYCTTIVP